jgi:hypothetical protein
MKLKKPAWRNAAYEYIKKNGPATSEGLLANMVTKKGLSWAQSNRAPVNASNAAQLLARDPRFASRWVDKTLNSSENRTYAKYQVREWRLADEEPQADTE